MKSAQADGTFAGKSRWAAILFADVVNSTEVAEQLGADAYYPLIRDLMREAWTIVEKRHGHTVEFGGDSLLATFGAPVAVENASANACRAALDIQAFVSREAPGFLSQYGHAPQLRIGLAGGVVTVGDLSINSKMNLNVLGSAVNMASRIEALASAGDVLISSRIRDQVDHLVDAEPMGEHDLKGFSDPVALFRLTGVRMAETAFQMRLGRGARQFTGREREIELLTAWARRAEGSRALIEVAGQAGIGKSRLFYELGNALASDIRLITASCDAGHRSVSYFPLVRLIRSYVGWSPDQPTAHLHAALSDAFGDRIAQAAPFFDLIAGTAAALPDAQRENAIEIRAKLSDVLRRMSEDPGVAILIEDTHWLDPTSAELLIELATRGELRAAITSRHMFPMDDALSDRVEKILLRPLEPDHLLAVIRSVLGVSDIPADLFDFVKSTSGGLPLFAEEVVQFLRQDGQIGIEAGRAVYTPDGLTLREAGNLQNLIMSAFDALSPGAQRCLEFAATKGRRFSIGFLEACMSDTDLVLAAVDEVTTLGIIEADPGGGRRALRFSHALMGDSIYRSVLETDRARLHMVVATAMAGDDGSTAAELAHHFERGGDAANAVRQYWRSATDAMAVYAVDIADRQLDRAFALIEEDPGIIGDDDYAELLLLHCRALDIFGNFRRLNEVVDQRGQRLGRLPPSPTYIICLTLQALSRCHGGAYAASLALIEQAQTLADDAGDDAAAAWVSVAKLRIYSDTESATNAEIEAMYRSVRPLAERLGDRHLIQASIYNMLASYRAVGELLKAEALIEELESYGRDHRDSRAVAYANWAKAVHCFNKRDREALRDATRTVFDHAVPGTADWRVASVFQVAIGLLKPDAGPDPDLFTPHIEKTRELEDFTLHHTTWIGRMMACFKTGQIARGFREMRELRADINRFGTNELQRVVLVFQAEILLAVLGLRRADGPRPKIGAADLAVLLRMRLLARRDAQRMFQDYIDSTPAQVGPLVARAYFGLGLLSKSRRKHDEARDYLKKAEALFLREGFDVAAAEAAEAAR